MRRRKIAIFQYATVVLFLFLISGFWRLQVQNPDYYNERAEENSIKSVPILAPRGRILDRDGRVIVDNHASFTLILTRENLKEEHLKPIAEGLDLDLRRSAGKRAALPHAGQVRTDRLKEEMTPADLAFVDSHRDFFPELVTDPGPAPLYPQNGMMAHVIGYTGEISEQELDTAGVRQVQTGRRDRQVRHRAAVQRHVDGRSTASARWWWITAARCARCCATKPAVPGKDLQLTIDLDLQAVAELAMDGKNGAVVALDPRNGEVLAMVSRPDVRPQQVRRPHQGQGLEGDRPTIPTTRC